MRLAELSRESGVPTATIKYYLREGLLRAGRRVTATQAEYDESHLRRLRLVRALVHVGNMPMTVAREALAAVEDASTARHIRLAAAVCALPHDSGPPPRDPATEAARHTADTLLKRLGWDTGRESAATSPAHGMLVTAIGTLLRLGYPCAVEDLAPYACAAARLAAPVLDAAERYPSPGEQLEAAAALTVLYEPILLSLRRIAEAEEAARRYETTPRA